MFSCMFLFGEEWASAAGVAFGGISSIGVESGQVPAAAISQRGVLLRAQLFAKKMKHALKPRWMNPAAWVSEID